MKYLAVLLAALLLAPCATLHAARRAEADSDGGGSRAIPPDFKVTKGIVYKKVGDKSLDLDLFLPKEKKFEKSPLVIYIHGGGWGGGDKYRVLKPSLVEVVRELNEKGLTVATIEYRLTADGITAFDSACDCKDAVRFLYKNAAQYGLDPDHIGTFGSSAGGHLTLVTALGDDKDYPGDPALADIPVKILCVAAHYPLVSLVDPEVTKGSNFENPNRLAALIGGSLKDKQDVALKLSPLSLLRPTSPPIFLGHGDADKTLSFHNSTMMRDAAKAMGVPVECLIAKGAGHGFSGTNIDPPIAEIAHQTAAFFLKYLVK